MSNVDAQLTKGTWLIGGSGSLYSYKEIHNYPINYTANYTNIDISPSVGYFPVDKLAVGLRPTFSSYKGESDGGGSTNSFKISMGPFVRYYFLDAEKSFNLLTDISYQLGINQYLGAVHEKGKYNTLSIKGGAEMFFNSAVGIEILLGYLQNNTSIENSPNAYRTIRKGFQASVGFQFHLEKL